MRQGGRPEGRGGEDEMRGCGERPEGLLVGQCSDEHPVTVGDVHGEQDCVALPEAPPLLIVESSPPDGLGVHQPHAPPRPLQEDAAV